MKKLILAGLVLLLGAGAALAQSFKPVLSDKIPAQAAEVLLQRLPQMLEAGGFSVADEGTPLEVEAVVESRMVSGAMSQVALTVNLVFRAGDVVETFPLKGVGADDADAWLRAMKQFLPRSKAAQGFVSKLK